MKLTNMKLSCCSFLHLMDLKPQYHQFAWVACGLLYGKPPPSRLLGQPSPSSSIIKDQHFWKLPWRKVMSATYFTLHTWSCWRNTGYCITKHCSLVQIGHSYRLQWMSQIDTVPKGNRTITKLWYNWFSKVLCIFANTARNFWSSNKYEIKLLLIFFPWLQHHLKLFISAGHWVQQEEEAADPFFHLATRA
jgi:hypothetical protein